MTERLEARRIRLEWPPDADLAWTPRYPELACMANSLSLAMPYVEPYVVRTTKAALPLLDDTLRADALGYMAQESNHHAQHRRLNDVMRARRPKVAAVERWMDRSYAWLEGHTSAAFGRAFAAGFETIAYSAACWLEPQLDELFADAQQAPASLFLWHLAEEVEHKGVAFDVQRATGGTRRQYAAGMAVALAFLAWFTTLGAIVLLAGERRLWRPVAWFRITRWLLSFLFHAGPVMLLSLRRSFHPSNLVDPALLTEWLGNWDAEARTLPPFGVLAA